MPLYSIGHSQHSIDRFLEMVLAHQIEVIVDVRSAPYSRWAPHFNSDNLRRALEHDGVRYLFMGDELGGRPEHAELWDADGKLSYQRWSEHPQFLAGIERLARGQEKYRVAVMCSEEDPSGCHRHHLVGRVLAERGVEMTHIRADGSEVPFSRFHAPPARSAGRWQLPLFDE